MFSAAVNACRGIIAAGWGSNMQNAEDVPFSFLENTEPCKSKS